MKKSKRTTKFTIETERTIIFRSFGRQQTAWCRECEAEAQMTTVPEAVLEAGLSELAIYLLIDTGAVHFKEDEEGRVHICLTSLAKQISKGDL
jgi:hypothetical protein